jgi:inositol transport system ATP-binding protein
LKLIEMKAIHKSFYGNEVLHGVDFSLEAGTVHALMGENGAGKSTLMKVLAGVHSATSGKVLMNGIERNIENPTVARELGIAMIHQELSTEVEMSVAENIYLGREPGKFGLVDYKQLYKQTQELLDSLGIKLNPKLKMKKLRVADQQMVEIAKAISQNAKVVIMDEPTSSITNKEVDRLFNMIRQLKENHVGIIYISHKMDEIFQIADVITVLRDGNYIGTYSSSEISENELIRKMVGRDLGEQFPKVSVPIGDEVLSVKHLTLKGQYEDISFNLHQGEILGLVGLVGAGRTETMHSLFGITHPDSGEIYLNGEKVEIKSPKDAINHGLAYVTEDRKGEGLFLPMSVEKNITITSLQRFTKNGFLQKQVERSVVDDQIKNLSIKVAKPSQSVKSLSGGNQQKVVLAKWMISNPKILIFDEPTRGIDVGAKAEIYKIMCEYVKKGNAIIMVSSEMPEAMGMSDRIIVLSNHRVSGEICRSEFSEETLATLQFRYMQSNKDSRSEQE